jgi:hypothetical protein
MPLCRRPNGYMQVGLTNKQQRHFHVHRLVLLAFVGPAPEGMECCHNDGNKANNALSNLRWDTRSANMKDRTRHGQARGELAGMAKLFPAQVLEIRRLSEGGTPNAELVRRYGVTFGAIRKILRRESWAHI